MSEAATFLANES